jgi:DNA-directed RNA polymerase subunit N (RpoN/RPB10)
MIIPIRCFTCNKVIADMYDYYLKRVTEKKLALKTEDTTKPSVIDINASDIKKTPEGEVLDELGLHRYCCRKILITHIELVNDI